MNQQEALELLQRNATASEELLKMAQAQSKKNEPTTTDATPDAANSGGKTGKVNDDSPAPSTPPPTPQPQPEPEKPFLSTFLGLDD